MRISQQLEPITSRRAAADFRRRTVDLASAVSVVAILCGGCSQPVGELSGNVSYKGKIFKSGAIVLVGSSGIPVTAPIQKDGTYSFAAIAAEQVKIGVIDFGPLGETAG